MNRSVNWIWETILIDQYFPTTAKTIHELPVYDNSKIRNKTVKKWNNYFICPRKIDVFKEFVLGLEIVIKLYK